MKGSQFSQERIIGILKEADCKTSTAVQGAWCLFMVDLKRTG